LTSNNEMSIRTQEIKESASVPSAEGLVMNLDTSLIYHLDPEKAADVYQKIGPNYRDVFIEPNLRAAIREATASHSANALYSGERELVAKQIRDQLTTLLGQRGILVESILLRDIQLPQTLKVSIEAKQQAEQEALAMSFRLQKEKQEAERKRIEAAGIRDFQQIVAQGISPQLLEWKGIEATENLAKSANAKVVVIGNPKNGLPLILAGSEGWGKALTAFKTRLDAYRHPHGKVFALTTWSTSVKAIFQQSWHLRERQNPNFLT